MALAGRLSAVEKHAAVEKWVVEIHAWEPDHALCPAQPISRMTEALCRLILEASPVPLLLTNGAGTILQSNQLAERLFGVHPHALDGAPIDGILPDLVRAPARGTAAETRARRRDGSSFPAEVAFSPLHGDVQSLFLCSVVDLTGRIRGSELFLRTVEACPTGMLVVDGNGTVVMANRHAGILLGYGPDELVGLPVESLVPPSVRPSHVHHRIDFAISPQARPMGQGSELSCLRKDGVEIPVELGLNPIRTAEGDFVLCSILDISDRRRYESELRKSLLEASASREAAEAATAAKGAFLAAMSHEIRTPLNGVLGIAQILLDTNLDPEQREYAEIVVRSGERLLGILNEILDASKLDAGKVVIERAPFDLRRVLEELVELYACKAAEKGLPLILDIPSRMPAEVTGDSLRLHQILTNLIGNAIKFTESGHILVTAHSRPFAGRHFWRLTVQDTGIGISPARVSQVFESFEQADNSTSRRFGGSGLGLSIARRLAELMGGRIRVTTRLGAGSKFRVLLPLPSGPLPAPVPLPDALAGLRVLVYSPHPVRRRALMRQFASGPGEFTFAATAAEARQALAKTPAAFRFFVVDAMPGDDEPLQIAASLGSSRPALVVLAASQAAGDRARFEEAGFDSYLVHPISPRSLFTAFANIVTPPGSVPPPPAPPAPFANRRALVADDDRVNQLVALRMLERLGFAVDLADDGGQAIAQASRSDYDAILLDCQMPGIDGYAATAQIRALESAARHTPVIAVTASATDDDRARCLAAGMDDFVTKPISAASLLSALERCLPS